MKKLKLVLVSLCTFMIVGCGANVETEQAGPVACENPLIPVEVDFSWDPEQLQSGEAATFKAVVTQDNLSVENANEVKFEIWEHNNPDYHYMEDTQNEGNGSYTLDWTFPEDGVYYAYYHVTACDMHRMEKVMIVVGDVNVDEITAEPDTVKGEMSSGHEAGQEQDEASEHTDETDEMHDQEAENTHKH